MGLELLMRLLGTEEGRRRVSERWFPVGGDGTGRKGERDGWMEGRKAYVNDERSLKM